jgi:radical SAM protein with 4Fe4S-binding SPASM domain
VDCVHLPELSYSEFSEQLHTRAVRECIPIAGSFEITHRCNLKCVHCYVNLPAAESEARRTELNAKEIGRILDEGADAGMVWLLFTGGEPLLRPDFEEIYTSAKRRGLLLTLFTNGTLITDRIADMLAEWRPFSVEVTLYGRTQETYERMTGVEGSHERCMRGIDALLQRDLPFKLKTTLTTVNRGELHQMQALARELDVEFRFDPTINPRIDGGDLLRSVRLSPAEAIEVDLGDRRRAESWVELVQKFSGPPDDPDRVYQCGAGKTTFNIDPAGRLSGCVISRSPCRDLTTESFAEAWRKLVTEIESRKWTEESECRFCRISLLCDQCPGWAQLECGEEQKPVDYLCRIAHMRYDILKPRLEETSK